MIFTAGTYIFDKPGLQFKVTIDATGEVLTTLSAPKALTLADFFNAEYWTKVD